MTDQIHMAGSPLNPVYHEPRQNTTSPGNTPAAASKYVPFEGGAIEIGHPGDAFCYDNELPVHKKYGGGFELQNRLVTNGEYLEFMNDGGYQDFRHWLSDGWRLSGKGTGKRRSTGRKRMMSGTR